MARAWSDIAEHLGLVLVDHAVGTTIFKGKILEPGAGVPALAIFCLPGISEAPEPFLNGAPADIRRYGVQVIVRAPAQDMEACADLADLVRDTLNHAKPLIGAGPATYITIDLDQASALRLDEDDEDRPRLSINLTAIAQETNP